MSVSMEVIDPGPAFPASFHKDLAVVNSNLYCAMTVWLKKHGKAIRPKLSEEQKGQMLECFELMDQDGSGAIDAEELGAAFKLLGINMKKSEMEQLVMEVDHDGSGEVEYEEFLEIMTTTLQRLAEEAAESDHNEGQVPFALMATAYRRKRLMEGIIKGDKEVQAQITEMSNKLNAEFAQEQLRKAEVARQLARKPALPAVASHHHQHHHHHQQVERAVLATLPADERRAVEAVARSPDSLTLVRRSMSQPRFSQWMRSADYHSSANHKQLLEMPELFDVRLNRPTIKLPPGLNSRAGTATSYSTSAGLPTPNSRRMSSPMYRGNSAGGMAMMSPRGSAPTTPRHNGGLTPRTPRLGAAHRHAASAGFWDPTLLPTDYSSLAAALGVMR